MKNTTAENGPLALNWTEQKAKLKKQFPFLTDADLTFEAGKREVMLNHLQITLGKTRMELQALLAAI